MPTWDEFMNERSAAGALADADDIIVQQSGVSVESNLGDLKTFINASLTGISETLFDANTILKADTDDTPEALTVAEQRVVGRITGGEITALTAAQIRTLINVEDDAAADQSAAEVDISDSGSLITATTVEAALQEVFNGSAAVNTVATSGATETLTLAPVHKVTMDQDCTFTFPTPTTASHVFRLDLAGAFTPTFPASVDWDSASAPTYATPSTYVFWTSDTGTNWRGLLAGSAFG